MSDKLHGGGGVKAGRTSVSVPVELRKSADSTELTGIVYTGVTASYWRQGGTRTAITAATLTGPSASYSSGGFVEVDGANMPGVYRFDVPDAAFATGADWVVVSLKVATAFVQTFFFPLETKGASDLNDAPALTDYQQRAVSVTLPANPPTDFINAASVKADAVTKIQTGLSTFASGGSVNVTQIAGQTASAAGTVTFPGAVASTTNITGGTITTVTNLTNAPTNGDLTAAMKTSISGLTIANVTTVATIGDSRIASILTAVTTPAATPTTDDIAAAVKTAIFTTVMASGSSPVYPTTQFGGMVWRIDKRAGDIYAPIPAMAAQLVRIHAAAVDSADVSGDTITLADGTVQTVSNAGRVTILA